VTGAEASRAFGIVFKDEISPHPIPNMLLLPMIWRTMKIVSKRKSNMTDIGKENLISTSRITNRMAVGDLEVPYRSASPGFDLWRSS
jgi:hypothetical protein